MQINPASGQNKDNQPDRKSRKRLSPKVRLFRLYVQALMVKNQKGVPIDDCASNEHNIKEQRIGETQGLTHTQNAVQNRRNSQKAKSDITGRD